MWMCEEVVWCDDVVGCEFSLFVIEWFDFFVLFCSVVVDFVCCCCGEVFEYDFVYVFVVCVG